MPRCVFCFLLILAVPAAGQNCTQTVPVLLADRDTGAPIEPVTAEMFTAKIGAAPLLISGATRIRASRIVVLIDESGSMSEIEPSQPVHKRYAVSTVKRTLNDLVAALPPGISVEYGVFNEKSAFSEAFASNSEELRRNIQETITRFGRKGYGNTALLDALHEALLRFGTPQPGDSILLFTDGGDNRSKFAEKQLEHDFRTAHVRLLTMMVVYAPAEEVSRGSVEDLAAKTGGSSLAIDATNRSWVDQKAMIRRFWNDRVLSTDVIQVQVPGGFTSETKWKLTVNREADPRLKHAIVIYPDRLGPCSLATASAH